MNIQPKTLRDALEIKQDKFTYAIVKAVGYNTVDVIKVGGTGLIKNRPVSGPMPLVGEQVLYDGTQVYSGGTGGSSSGIVAGIIGAGLPAASIDWSSISNKPATYTSDWNTMLNQPSFLTPTDAAATYLPLAGGTMTGQITTQSLIPSSTEQYDLGSINYRYKDLYASRTNATVFVESTAQLFGGWLIVPKDVGSFTESSGVTTTVNFAQDMTVGDIVIVKGKDTGGTFQTEYMRVVSLISGTTYNAIRDARLTDGTHDFPSGTPFSVAGHAGDGRVEIQSYDSPRISMIQLNDTGIMGGMPWIPGTVSEAEYFRAGDLNGIAGYTTTTQGLFIGDSSNYIKYADGGLYITGTVNVGGGAVTLDENGITIDQGSGEVNQIKWSSSGSSLASIYWDADAVNDYFILSTPSPSTRPQYIALATGGVFVYQDSTTDGYGSDALSAAFGVVSATHTGDPASSERISVNIDLSADVQHKTGDMGWQRAMVINGPTYSFVGASVITNAATLYMTGPTAGTNATITNSYGLVIASGKSLFGDKVEVLGNLRVGGPPYPLGDSHIYGTATTLLIESSTTNPALRLALNAVPGAADTTVGAIVTGVNVSGSFTGGARMRFVSHEAWTIGANTGNYIALDTTPLGGTAQVTKEVVGRRRIVTNNSSTAVASFTIANGSSIGGVIRYTVEVTNGTDYQVETGEVTFHCNNKAGAFSGNSTTKFGNIQAMTSGTLTVTWTITAANPAVLTVNCNSSLVPSAGYPRVNYTLENLTGQAVALS